MAEHDRPLVPPIETQATVMFDKDGNVAWAHNDDAAYAFYGEDAWLAYEVAKKEGHAGTYVNDPKEEARVHYRDTAITRAQLRDQAAQRSARRGNR